MLLISVPLWITEIAPPKGRGVLANIHGLMAVFGYLIASYVGVGFYYYQGGSGNQWRAPLAFACLPPLITLGFLWKLSESPRCLLSKDQNERAWKVVESLHRSSDDPDSHYARKEFLQMKRQHELDRSFDFFWKIMCSTVLPQTSPDCMRLAEFHLQLGNAFNLQLRPLSICRIGIQNVSNPPIPGWHHFGFYFRPLRLVLCGRSNTEKSHLGCGYDCSCYPSGLWGSDDIPIRWDYEQVRSGGRSCFPVYLHLVIRYLPRRSWILLCKNIWILSSWYIITNCISPGKWDLSNSSTRQRGDMLRCLLQPY